LEPAHVSEVLRRIVSAVIGSAVPGLGPVIDAAVAKAARDPAVVLQPRDAKPVAEAMPAPRGMEPYFWQGVRSILLALGGSAVSAGYLTNDELVVVGAIVIGATMFYRWLSGVLARRRAPRRRDRETPRQLPRESFHRAAAFAEATSLFRQPQDLLRPDLKFPPITLPSLPQSQRHNHRILGPCAGAWARTIHRP